MGAERRNSASASSSSSGIGNSNSSSSSSWSPSASGSISSKIVWNWRHVRIINRGNNQRFHAHVSLGLWQVYWCAACWPWSWRNHCEERAAGLDWTQWPVRRSPFDYVLRSPLPWIFELTNLPNRTWVWRTDRDAQRRVSTNRNYDGVELGSLYGFSLSESLGPRFLI